MSNRLIYAALIGLYVIAFWSGVAWLVMRWLG